MNKTVQGDAKNEEETEEQNRFQHPDDEEQTHTIL